MIDRKLTQQLQQWLEAKAEDRDIATGAMLLRRLVRNLTFAANFERNPKRHMKMAEYQLSKYLPMRLAEITHEDMVVMTKKVKEINGELRLDEPLPGKKTEPEVKRIAKTTEFRAGKRPDHDQLPEEIQACYAENLSIMQNMRACHAQLVLLSTQEKQSVCPDGDRYPFVKEIIALDEKYRQNWQRYDEYPAQE
jgi:hypothetical protein